MAARVNLRHDEEVRAKIQTSQLVNLLSEHALEGRKVAQSRLRAAEVLLRKTLPDLSAVAYSGQLEVTPIQISHTDARL